MLHLAAGLGLMTIIEYLLSKVLFSISFLTIQKGASTATEDNSGSPPLAYAERGKHERAVAVLLDSAKGTISSIFPSNRNSTFKFR